LSTIQELFRKGKQVLLGVAAEPSIEAKVILLESTGLNEAQFLAFPQRVVSRREESAFGRMLNGRLSGIPLAYLTEAKEFRSLPLRIRPGVFIPRPETELIVEKVLGLSSRQKETIIDVGTGSGNIALALAQELRRARILATDISARALRLAKFNAFKHKAAGISFAQGSLFKALKGLHLEGRCNFIVSNPPYVPAGDWETLSPEIRDHEPKRALVPGKTGLEFIRRLIKASPTYLRPGGYLLFEIGQGQRQDALCLFDQNWSEVESFDDLRGIPRLVKARKT
jgi:release factor glutamine methyltransferase